MYNQDLSKFHEEGYVLLKNIIPNENLKLLLDHQDICFDDYSSSFDDAISRDHAFYQNKIYLDKEKKIRIDGVPTNHRILRGVGSPIITDTPFALYGKRASKNIKDFNSDILQSIFFEDLIEIAKKLLTSEKLSFLEGSANRMYPSYSGEDKVMHMDTYGFTYGNNKILSEDNFFINALLYLNGSKDGRSPTKIIPKSHKKHSEVNALASKALRLKPSYNVIHQRELYEEILPENLKSQIIEVEADPGDILIINSNLVHGISGNSNSENVREAVILNFGKASSKHFGKSRSNQDYRNLKQMLQPFELYLGNLHFSSKFRNFLGTIISILKTRLLLLRKPKSSPTQDRISIEDMPYLNIGSGANWKDPLTVGLDINIEKNMSGKDAINICDVEFDLLSNDRLPFENSRFEGIYTSHTYEHLQDINVAHITSEVHRVLKPGGCFRVTVPDIDLYFDAYEARDLHFFNWVRNKNVYRYDSWLRLITREFAGPVVDDFADNDLLDKLDKLGRQDYLDYFQKLSNDCDVKERLIPDIHKSYWNPKKMIQVMKKSGFSQVKETTRFGSRVPYFADKENNAFNRTRPHASLFVEGVK